MAVGEVEVGDGDGEGRGGQGREGRQGGDMGEVVVVVGGGWVEVGTPRWGKVAVVRG